MPVCAVSRMLRSLSISIAPGRLRAAALAVSNSRKVPRSWSYNGRAWAMSLAIPRMSPRISWACSLRIGAGDDQRVLDRLARRAGKQPVEAAVDGHVGDDRHQHRRQHRDDREQADDLDMQPGRRPAAAPGLHQLPDFADDDADQQQDGGAALISMKEYDDVRRRLDRVRPVSTTKVRKADSRARPTANGASNLRRGSPWARRTTGRTVRPRCLRWSFRQRGELKAWGPPGSRLMHSYHNVAELRQFHGALPPCNRPRILPEGSRQATAGQPLNCRCGRPGCPDREFSCAACCG